MLHVIHVLFVSSEVFDDDGEESVETEAELEAEQVDPADLTAMECKTKGNECLQKKHDSH